MADIFARAGNDFRGAFAADAARIVFAGSDASDFISGNASVGLITQNINVAYTQQISRLYEIGTNFTYLVGGRTQGQVGLGRVLGPRPIQISFYTKYGNVCNAATNVINILCDTGCPKGNQSGVNPGATGGLTNGTYKFKLANCVITNIGITVQAQDMIINEQLQLMFVSLENA